MSRDILLDNIHPNRNQPRTQFDRAGLEELARSMGDHGLLSPILVRAQGDAFEIVHGERRTRAARLLGWATIAANVVEMSDEQAQWAALVENVQRDDLSPLEEAAAYRAMIDAGYTQAQISEKISKTQSYVATKLRLLAMPEPLKPWLNSKILAEGHVKQLLRLRKFYQGIGRRQILADHVCRDGIPQALVDLWSGSPAGDDLLRLSLFYNGIRPWDSAAVQILPMTPECAIVALESIDLMLKHETDGAGTVEPWIPPALWFAAFAGHIDLSVTDLNGVITRFMGMMYGHAVYSDRVLAGDKDKREYWGRRSDLRHAGLSGPLPAEFTERATVNVLRNNFVAMPSTMQPWHTGEDWSTSAEREIEAG